MKISSPEQQDLTPVEFSPEMMTEINQVIGLFPEGKSKSALIRILHIVQTHFGWTSVPAMNKVAEILSIQPIEVYEVATFYTMFHLNPVGNYVFEVCRTGPCMIVGSDDIIAYIEQKLNIKVGGTTSDGMFTLKTAECLGGCGYGPVMQCKYKFHEHLTTEKVDEIIEAYRTASISK
ncbi:MAG: NADH-quinone oxidoreductase subunit NuoE [Crocinitomicaceae bacterium]|jgi:NADH-quinone oxidoreductase subunit E|nr:NADH-quinone oxidoreductase subunit NuoE [Crocinitomicaceae bacterium]MDP4760848.1 NADH-quinone oxidoreductase subunit NuoE [Crocinitomicaceae bacterium]